jgi:hypothetical protein
MRDEISPHRSTKDHDSRTKLGVKMSAVIVKVSMDDLYILSSIGMQLAEQAMGIGNLWLGYMQTVVVKPE